MIRAAVGERRFTRFSLAGTYRPDGSRTMFWQAVLKNGGSYGDYIFS